MIAPSTRYRRWQRTCGRGKFRFIRNRPRISDLLTDFRARHIVTAQFSLCRLPMSSSNFKTLESKIDELIKLCSDMKKENQMLRDREQHLRHEREALLGKNQLARVRLEKVLRRLKSLEEDQS
jgi:cell division protein ZapB